jgi:uncharacterized glyoxalase superfamily metalloenzyme YdcJ
MFAGEHRGTHSARFGEIEQRGVALTPKGRALYDRLLQAAGTGKDNLSHSCICRRYCNSRQRISAASAGAGFRYRLTPAGEAHRMRFARATIPSR